MKAKELISDLAGEIGFPKISLYFPTHVSGPEIQQDPIRLKNALKEATKSLESHDLETEAIEALLSEATQLVDDLPFWQHQKNGLAIFIDEDQTRHHKLAFSPREKVSVGESFYTLPLLRMTGTGETFHVLTLNRSGAQLFDADRDGMTMRPLTMTPDAMAEDRGESDFNDDTGSHPNSRGSQGGGAAGVPQMHALGTGKEEQAETELWRFLSYVEKQVDDALADSDAPIVLIGGDRIVGHYRNVAQAQKFAAGAVQKNTTSMSDDEIHAAAVEAVRDTLNAPRQEALEIILSRLATNSGTKSSDAAASNDADKILAAALEGRVDTVLIDFAGRDGSRSELLDRIAQVTLQHGGRVMALPTEADEELSPVSAYYRY